MTLEHIKVIILPTSKGALNYPFNLEILYYKLKYLTKPSSRKYTKDPMKTKLIRNSLSSNLETYTINNHKYKQSEKLKVTFSTSFSNAQKGPNFVLISTNFRIPDEKTFEFWAPKFDKLHQNTKEYI